MEENITYEIIVVDNGSTDGSLSIIDKYEQKHSPNFIKITFQENMGTTYSRNLAQKNTIGKYICILDSDTMIKEGSLLAIIETLANNHEIGIIAPQLLLPDGNIQVSVKRFPTFWHKLAKIPKAVLRFPLTDFDFYQSFPFKQNTFVETAISACWFLRNDLFSKLGPFDEKIFYSPEDLDFCLRVWKKGLKILYYPSFKVLHDTQRISHKAPFSKSSLSHLRGLLYYFKKHGGWFSTNALREEIEGKLE
jgi:GT2 family glycosyltransferase